MKAYLTFGPLTGCIDIQEYQPSIRIPVWHQMKYIAEEGTYDRATEPKAMEFRFKTRVSPDVAVYEFDGLV